MICIASGKKQDWMAQRGELYGSRIIFYFGDKEDSVRPETIQITVELERPLRFVGKAVGISEVVGVDGIQQALDEFSHENPKFKLQPITPDFA
jgi:hypothetical protein